MTDSDERSVIVPYPTVVEIQGKMVHIPLEYSQWTIDVSNMVTRALDIQEAMKYACLEDSIEIHMPHIGMPDGTDRGGITIYGFPIRIDPNANAPYLIIR